MTTTLAGDIASYEEMRSELESAHLGKWVVIFNGKVAGTFENFDDAAGFAVKSFGRGPYLIRQIGSAPATLPVSVMYGPIRNASQVRF